MAPNRSNTLRLRGLVRIANQARHALSGPLTAEARDHWRRQVSAALRTVDQWLSEHRATLLALPSPSRKAYQFLAAIDFSTLAVAAASPAEQPVPGSVRLSGLRKAFNQLLERLATAPPQQQGELLKNLAALREGLAQNISCHDLQWPQLTPEARAIYGWLTYFAKADRLAVYLASRDQARQVFAEAARASRGFHPDVRVAFRPTTSLFHWRNAAAASHLNLPTPMISFDGALFSHLAGLAIRRRRDREPILAAMYGPPYQTLQAELNALSGAAEQTQGAIHDLDRIFTEVNRSYFKGALARPRLTWNKTFTQRKVGHYDPVTDTVMISASLDHPDAPAVVVAFVLYHELLHKVHGADWRNGRARVHTPAFRRDERRFQGYQEAEAWLTKWVSS